MAAATQTTPQTRRSAPNNLVPFWYLLNPAQLTALQQGVAASFTVDSENDFLWDRIVTESTGIFSLYPYDKIKGLPLCTAPSAPIYIENFGGIAGLPFWLSSPYLIRRGSTIEATFNDRSGNPNTIQLAFAGRPVGMVLQ